MDIGRVIMEMLKRRGDDSAIPVAATGPAEAMAAEAVTAPPEPAAPAPAAPAPVAEAYKSPPDLVAMYTKMMEKSRNAALMDSGMAMVAAGFAQPQNRAGLMAMANNAGSGGGNAPSMSELLALQKYSAERQDVEARRSMLPQIMEQHNLSEADVRYLDATGTLDETLAQLVNPGTEVVESGVDGSKMLINSVTGETIKNISGAKPRPTEYIEMGDKNKVLVYSDDKTRVDTGEAITETGVPKGAITTVELSDGTQQAVQDGKPLGDPFGPEEEAPFEYRTIGNGQIQVYQRGKPVGEPQGPETITWGVVELGDGTQQRTMNGLPMGKPYGPKTDISTEDQQELAQINAEHRAKGEPEETLDEWIIRRTQSGTEAGTIAELDKTRYGTPPNGQYFVRDTTGAVVTNEDGTPKTAWDTTSKEYQEYQKTQTAAKTEADAAVRAEEGRAEADTAEGVKRSMLNEDIDNAIKMLEENVDDPLGVTGMGALLRYAPWENKSKTMDGYLSFIKTTIGFQGLQDMRASSPTGGALGSVSEGEHAMLQRLEGTINQGGDDQTLIHNLKRIKVGRDMIVNGVYDESYTNPNAKTEAQKHYRSPTPEEIDAAMAAIKEDGVDPDAPKKKGGYVIRKSGGPTANSVDPNAGVPTGN
jgi:hypothetical protein